MHQFGLVLPLSLFEHNSLFCLGQGFHTQNGDIFVKINTNVDALSMFLGEMNSLKALRQTNTIYAPKPLCIVQDPKSEGGAIVMEYLEMAPVTEWTKLGSDLADLHLFNSVLEKKKSKLQTWISKPPEKCTYETEMVIEKEVKLQIADDVAGKMEYVDQFGFEGPTYCGLIMQNNEWRDNWIEFYARNKLDVQINLIVENYGDREIVEYWSDLQLKIDRLFRDMRRPLKPALLHGDLWSGNVSQVGDKSVIFDPASLYGHSEFELSISTLFGGFSPAFFEEYFRKIPKEKGFEM